MVDGPQTTVKNKTSSKEINGRRFTVRRGLALLAQLLRIQKTNNMNQFPQKAGRLFKVISCLTADAV
jgi:hypothetical protein